jgi:hypothetical protein
MKVFERYNLQFTVNICDIMKNGIRAFNIMKFIPVYGYIQDLFHYPCPYEKVFFSEKIEVPYFKNTSFSFRKLNSTFFIDF